MILFKNGTVVDGTQSATFRGDVLVDGERIAAVGRVETPADAKVIDCTGLTVCPGFIDAHSHSDLQVLEGREEKILQGVTAEVVGNCGFSTFPAADDRKPLYDFANGILCGSGNWGWKTAGDYLAEVGRKARLTIASHTGHGALRIAQVGHRLGALPEPDIVAMERTLSDNLSAGSCGFTTGLMYAPVSSAPTEELERLCRVVARHGLIHASHIRDYASSVVDAIDEQIGIARRTGCRLQISHLQVVGAANWPLQQQAIDHIEKARREGIDVEFDCYPYVAGSTVLTQILPVWTLEGGIDALMTRLKDESTRRRIITETVATMAWRWSDIYISAVASERNQPVVGMNLDEIARQRKKDPADVMADLLIEEHGAVNMLSFNQSEENLRQTLTHPLSIVISDGFYVHGRPHPRLHGTFPTLLGEYVRKRRWLSLEEAVNKITDRPARRYGLRNRGRLEAGYYADITVIDAATIGTTATYKEPDRKPTGIRCVYRNGKVLHQEG